MLGEFVPTAQDETFHTVCMICAWLVEIPAELKGRPKPPSEVQ
jgi:hypothetical protein